MILRRLSTAVLGAVLVAAAQLVAVAPAHAAPRVLYYDASRAAEFVQVVHQGAGNWNSRVTNVRLEPVPSGRRANITVLADNGWPRRRPFKTTKTRSVAASGGRSPSR